MERIIADFNIEVNFDTQTHIKKGGYHNSEVFYDDYLVRLIQAKLLNNKANQGNNSDEIKELVANSVKNELTKDKLNEIVNKYQFVEAN